MDFPQASLCTAVVVMYMQQAHVYSTPSESLHGLVVTHRLAVSAELLVTRCGHVFTGSADRIKGRRGPPTVSTSRYGARS